jgi:competence protein ComEA
VTDRRKIELAAYAVAAFILVFLAARVLDGRGQEARAPVTLSGAGKPASKRASRKPALVVYVAGEVRTPGVYRIPAGSRVGAAVQHAGGLTRRGDATAVNLAAPVQDGQQIVVPRRGAAGAVAGAPAGGSAAPGAGGAPAQPVSLSTATVEQLDTIDGIGPTLAGRIVEYREAHGGFRSVEQLRQVDGIGEKRFESLKAGVQP